MSQTGGEHLVRRLIAWGVTRVYDYPGDGIDRILGGFHAVEGELEFIQTRHEALASFQGRVDDPDRVGHAWDRALSAGRDPAAGQMVRESFKGKLVEFLKR